MTQKGVILGPITDPHTAAYHATENSGAYHNQRDTPYRRPSSHRSFSRDAVDPGHVHHTNTTTKHHQNCLTAPTEQPGKTKTGNIKQFSHITKVSSSPESI